MGFGVSSPAPVPALDPSVRVALDAWFAADPAVNATVLTDWPGAPAATPFVLVVRWHDGPWVVGGFVSDDAANWYRAEFWEPSK